MEHENGGWMNDDQKDTTKDELDRLLVTTDTTPNRQSFGDELACLLNKYSKENGSNTPDFILAEYLTQQLEVWNLVVRAREEWYGRKFSQGSLGVQKEPSTSAKEIAARVWCDQEMGNIVMDVEAAEAIARIIDDVRRNQADKQSCDDMNNE